jgi:hypothetical protein
MNEENLRQLRRVVEAAPEERFHMRSIAEMASCGTAFCALGWFALDPWARANTSIVSIVYAFYSCLSAASLFGISEGEAEHLFGISLPGTCNPHCVTKAEVLWNIDELLAGRTTRPYAALAGFSVYDSHCDWPYAADRDPRTVLPARAVTDRVSSLYDWYKWDDEMVVKIAADPHFNPDFAVENYPDREDDDEV